MTAMPKIKRDAAGRQRRDVREAGEARGAFEAEMRRHGLAARTQVTIERTPAPDDVAERLGVREGTEVLVRRGAMYAGDVPVQVAAGFLPLDVAEGSLLAEDTGPGGTYSRLADLGHEPTSFVEDVDVRPPSDEEVRVLRMTEGQRVYEIVREARTSADRVVEVDVIVLPVHQWCLRYKWPAE